MAQKKPVQALFDARGRLLIERRGLPSATGARLANDAYHWMRTATWTRIALLFFALFMVVNVVFALVLWVGHARILNAHGFLDCLWFSVQTMGTIGYGYLAPDDTLANVVVTIESFIGIIFTAVATGIFFARFATPSARVIFSRVVLISPQEGKRMLMFRMANARATAIVEAVAHAYLNVDELLPGGERMRRIYDLPLRRQTSPVFALSWTAYHVIDEASPLYNCTAESLALQNVNIIITFQGTDDRLAATVHTRYTYSLADVVFGHRFVDIFRLDDGGARYLDFERFHETEPILPPAAEAISPADSARAG